MYKIRSEAEDRIYGAISVCSIWSFYGDKTLYAASFIGRPSSVQAICAGLQ